MSRAKRIATRGHNEKGALGAPPLRDVLTAEQLEELEASAARRRCRCLLCRLGFWRDETTWPKDEAAWHCQREACAKVAPHYAAAVASTLQPPPTTGAAIVAAFRLRQRSG